MKRMSSNASKYEVSYGFADTEDPVEVKKKYSPCCASTKRRFYLVCGLIFIVLVWIFVYYKLLNHRFELPEPLRELRKMFGDGEVKKRRGREEETENIIFSSERPCFSQFQKKRSSEVIHIAITACHDYYEEAIVNMKAITLFTNYNLFFHIFTDRKHIKLKTFDKELQKWPAWTEHWMMFTIHPISFPPHETYEEWFGLFKPCASQRLFLANILIDVDSLIYVDSDVLFLDAVEHLWNVFKKFSKEHIAALSFECERKDNCWYNHKLKHPYFKPYGLNNGIMLMNLTRMRKQKWERNLIEIYSTYKKQIAFGDQDILNIYFHNYRKRLHQLQCNWNYRPDHCIHGNTCKEAYRYGISTLNGNRGVFRKSNLQPEFYLMFDAIRNYKFSDDFQNKVVNVTRDSLNLSEHRLTPCGQMADAFLKHISCVNRS